ncbi:MAG: GHKL domain-containing protein [Chitinophagales bacterium]|nr:GHKL domain-containing protein [Chitinophagales bacterium]
MVLAIDILNDAIIHFGISMQTLLYVSLILNVLILLWSYKRNRLIKKMNADLKGKNSKVREMNIELNTMNLEAVSMQAELIKTKQDLEAIVQERTRDLTESNISLRSEIKEREKIEVELEQRAIELTMANNDIRQFAYITFHDLREPLRMVTNYLQLIRKRYSPQLGPEAEEFFKYASEGANRINELVKDIQRYATIGVVNKVPDIVDMNNVLTKVIQQLKTKDLKRKFSVVIDDLPEIYGLQSHMFELTSNLLENSITFCEADEAKIYIQCEETLNQFKFSIHDNGVGMDEAYADKVFNIFQRLERRNDESGTGIGLSICKRIVEQYGGRIWYKTHEEGGTIFYFTLPKADELKKAV